MDAGDITFASGSGAIVLSGGTINLAATSTITVDNASNTISSILAGAATSLTKSGVGTLTLNGTYSSTGTTSVTGGLLNFNGGGTLQTVQVTGGGISTTGGAITNFNHNTGAGTSTIGAGTAITGTATVNAGTVNFNSTSASNGTLTLPAASTGTVIVGTGARVATANVSANAGTLNATQALTISNQLLLPNSITATISSGQTFTAQAGSLAVDSARTLTLSGGTLTFTAPPSVPTSGLLRHYTFDGTSADVSPNAGIGTLTGGAALVTGGGKYGTGYLSIPSQSAVLTIGNSASDAPQLGTSYTLTTWYQNLYSTTTYRTLWRGLENVPSTGPGDHQVIVSTGTNNLGIYGNKSGGAFLQAGGATVTTGAQTDNTWHFMAVVVDNVAGTQNFYTDSGASLSLLGTLSKTMQNNYLAAFGNYQGGAQAFANKLDDAYVYNRALTNTELTAIMSNGAAGSLQFPNTAISATVSSVLDLGAGTADHTLGSVSITGGVSEQTLQVNNAQSLTVNGIYGVYPSGGSGPQLAALSGSTIKNTGGTVDVASNLTLRLASVLADGNGSATTPANVLTKTGAGTLTLAAANTYSGTTTISNGTLKIGVSGAVPTGTGKGNVVLDGGATSAGTLDLNGIDTTVNGLAGVTGAVLGQVVNNATGTNKTLTVGNADAPGTFAGLIKDSTSGTGTVALTKIGTNTQTLTGANTYSGLTTVSAGTLNIQQSSALGTTAGDTTVSSGGKLQLQNNITVAGEALSLAPTATAATPVQSATGGTLGSLTIGSQSYELHTFTTTGTSSLTVNVAGTADYLVVGGGGGGGNSNGGSYWGTGGGGAGGYRSSVAGELSGGNAAAESPLAVNPGAYTVTVGGGGGREHQG